MGAAEAARDGLLPGRNGPHNGICFAKQVERMAAQSTLNVNDAPQRGHDLALAH